MRVWRTMLHAPVSVMIGVMGGVLGVYTAPAWIGAMTSVYDGAFPVLTMRGQLVGVGDDYVDVHVTGRKHRGEECRLVSVYGYTLRPDGLRSDAVAARIDLPQNGRMRGDGFWDIGVWRIRPVDRYAIRAEMWTHHNCIGRDILTRVADVEVPH